MYFNNSLFMITHKDSVLDSTSPQPLPQGDGLNYHSSHSPSLAEGDKGGGSKSPSHRYLAPYMKEFSRTLRKVPTQAESKLWQELRNKKLGVGFRRQFVIDSKYIADFVCLEKRLIIECDGGGHNGNFKDIERDFYLESQNFRILRFWNNEIIENVAGVVWKIKEVLEDLSTHPLTPSAKGGGIKESHFTTEKESAIESVFATNEEECGKSALIASANDDFLLYVLGLCNSTLYRYLVTQMTNLIQEGKYAYGAKDKIEKLPIPKISKAQVAEFSKIVNEIIECKKSNAMLKDLESRLDSMVYALYGLNDEEIELISKWGGGITLALLLIASIEARLLELVKLLCANFENELKVAFKFCEGLKVPSAVSHSKPSSCQTERSEESLNKKSKRCSLPLNMTKLQYEGKIIYPETTQSVNFVLDKMGYFLDKTAFMIKGENLVYLNAVLASKTSFWYLKHICSTLGASGFSMSKIFVEKLPVVETHKIDSKLLSEIENLASEILTSKTNAQVEAVEMRNCGFQARNKGVYPQAVMTEVESEESAIYRSNATLKELESRLDALIYQAYGLNKSEIALIESEFNNKERERERERERENRNN
ncbi:DUF559 domain-containing protein [Helicobacter himalayensis]|uniref:DUF559 domain-containing protein n=1 Tax=Helicobacter himalayensis TaxID=1591088 RepID=UPI003D6F0C27